ncbi:hypothetical protein [Flavobacterium sp.]|jgi:hypothetical protein|uniref:hypothetical protein n=1 Tax=Flavobacterium sp. TaxID=239 RepID=UPI0037BFBD14
MMKSKISKIKFRTIAMMFVVLSSINVQAQIDDDEGPAPPPPTAPINDWVPFCFTGAIALGGIILLRKAKVNTNC